MLLLILSAFMVEPVPMDMPLAEAYLVKEDGAFRLEDRYDRSELWMSRASLGCWTDDDCRGFALWKLDAMPPAVGEHETVTRAAYEPTRTPVGKKDAKRIRRAIERLSPCPISEEGRPPRQLPRGYRDVDYWQEPTNESTIVCAFLPEKSDHWYLAVWELDDADNIYERMGFFEDNFLVREFPSAYHGLERKDVGSRRGGGGRKADPQQLERALLRADARHSVAPYSAWRATDGEDFTVLDDLPGSSRFVVALTNDLPALRRSYAETLPSPINGTNALCVARIFADRDEYLATVGDEMEWTAAYWDSSRRELVAYLPIDGEAKLLRTIRHEAFHQYLSYATAFIPTSPWINEGYAQYFEDSESRDWGLGVEVTPERLGKAAAAIPQLMKMDYSEFYSGTDEERRVKYRLAWSIAVFVEKGAPKVRFAPFKDLKRDYVAALIKSQDMFVATSSAFGSADKLKLFVSEWLKFWTERQP